MAYLALGSAYEGDPVIGFRNQGLGVWPDGKRLYLLATALLICLEDGTQSKPPVVEEAVSSTMPAVPKEAAMKIAILTRLTLSGAVEATTKHAKGIQG